jgi:hypothetical protein
MESTGHANDVRRSNQVAGGKGKILKTVESDDMVEEHGSRGHDTIHGKKNSPRRGPDEEEEELEDDQRTKDEQMKAARNYNKPWRQQKVDKEKGDTPRTEVNGAQTNSKNSYDKPWKRNKTKQLVVNDDDDDDNKDDEDDETIQQQHQQQVVKISKQRQVKRPTVPNNSLHHSDDDEVTVQKRQHGVSRSTEYSADEEDLSSNGYKQNQQQQQQRDKGKGQKAQRKATGRTEKKYQDDDDDDEDDVEEFDNEDIDERTDWRRTSDHDGVAGSRIKKKLEDQTNTGEVKVENKLAKTKKVVNGSKTQQKDYVTNSDYKTEQERAAVQIQKTYRGYKVRSTQNFAN